MVAPFLLQFFGGETMVKVNGELFNIAGMTVSEYLEQSRFDRARIAVELNEEFLPKAKYSETVLKDSDSLEIVSFVGGG